jgi:cell division protein FtsW (lipid II flippase)
MKRYLILLLLNIIGIIIAFAMSTRNGGGGNTDPLPIFFGLPIMGAVSFICLITIAILDRKTILNTNWNIIIGTMILLINLMELQMLYYLFFKKYE